MQVQIKCEDQPVKKEIPSSVRQLIRMAQMHCYDTLRQVTREDQEITLNTKLSIERIITRAEKINAGEIRWG